MLAGNSETICFCHGFSMGLHTYKKQIGSNIWNVTPRYLSPCCRQWGLPATPRCHNESIALFGSTDSVSSSVDLICSSYRRNLITKKSIRTLEHCKLLIRSRWQRPKQNPNKFKCWGTIGGYRFGITTLGSCKMVNLVGGFNPFEKSGSSWIISPNREEYTVKHSWNHHPVKSTCLPTIGIIIIPVHLLVHRLVARSCDKFASSTCDMFWVVKGFYLGVFICG